MFSSGIAMASGVGIVAGLDVFRHDFFSRISSLRVRTVSGLVSWELEIDTNVDPENDRSLEISTWSTGFSKVAFRKSGRFAGMT